MLSHIAGFQRSLGILAGRDEKTVRSYSRQVEAYLAWLVDNNLPTAPALSVQEHRRHIEDYLEHCFYQRNSNQTRYTKITALAKFFRYLKYARVIAEDPTEGMPRPQLTKKLMLTFTREEVLRFFRQCDPSSEKGLRDTCIIILAAFCGLRMNEMITLNLNDVIDDGKDIDINVKGKRRGGRLSRQVWLWKAPTAPIPFLSPTTGAGRRAVASHPPLSTGL